MKGDIDSVNHVGLVVEDIGAAARRFEAFGFILTPLSMHSGARKPGEPEIPYGSGNRCAIFPDNYLEIVAHVDKDKYDLFCGKFLKRFEGAHIICFGCGDARVVDARLRSVGIGTSGVIPLKRDLDTPEGMRTAKFDCVHFDYNATPEGLIQAAYHVTPQYIHQPRYIGHPNKVTALSDVYLAVADPDEAAARYEKFTGAKCERRGSNRIFKLPRVSKVTILPAAEAPVQLPGAPVHQGAYLAGFAFTTADLPAMATRLRASGIRFAEHNGRLVVPAQEAFGAAVVFERA
jgi:Glyoxalase-like domain